MIFQIPSSYFGLNQFLEIELGTVQFYHCDVIALISTGFLSVRAGTAFPSIIDMDH